LKTVQPLLACGTGGLREQAKVAAGAGDVLFHDQLVPGVDGTGSKQVRIPRACRPPFRFDPGRRSD
jgi:hypothetical protein